MFDQLRQSIREERQFNMEMGDLPEGAWFSVVFVDADAGMLRVQLRMMNREGSPEPTINGGSLV